MIYFSFVFNAVVTLVEGSSHQTNVISIIRKT